MRAGTDAWVGTRGVSDLVARTPLAIDGRMLVMRGAASGPDLSVEGPEAVLRLAKASDKRAFGVR